MKSIILAAVAAPFIAAPAIAGPYVNVEANSGFTGSDYEGTTTEAHVGYEGDLGSKAGYYVQAGPAFVSEDGSGTDTELSGKAASAWSWPCPKPWNSTAKSASSLMKMTTVMAPKSAPPTVSDKFTGVFGPL